MIQEVKIKTMFLNINNFRTQLIIKSPCILTLHFYRDNFMKGFTLTIKIIFIMKMKYM